MAFSDERSELVFMAKLAEQAERYDDMVKHMKKIALMDVELTVEERNLFSVAFKNVVGAIRSAWRIIHSRMEHSDKLMAEAADKYSVLILSELDTVCKEMIGLLDNHLIPKSTLDDASVFLMKMKGDYYRYLAECYSIERKGEPVKMSLEAYEKAKKRSDDTLCKTHPIRLGLALNFSVFYFEIAQKPEEACTLARQAFDDAISDLDQLGEDSYKDSTLIMQLLRDNLTLWTSEQGGENEEQDD